jgi:hypothetical protein
MSRHYRTQVFGDIASIGRHTWNALLAGDAGANPFVRHEYLHALEASGCVGQRSGWTPQHLTLWHGEQLFGAVPLYVKSHSFGEYVFDWADACARYGLACYQMIEFAIERGLAVFLRRRRAQARARARPGGHRFRALARRAADASGGGALPGARVRRDRGRARRAERAPRLASGRSVRKRGLTVPTHARIACHAFAVVSDSFHNRIQ